MKPKLIKLSDMKRNYENYWVLIIMGILILAAYTISMNKGVYETKSINVTMLPEDNEKDTIPPKIARLTQDTVMFWLLELEIKSPEIVMAQALLETGNFTSARLEKYNSLFGFQTSDIDINYFPDWLSSIIAYKEWQNKYYNEEFYESYYDFLESYEYARDSLYIQKLKRFKIVYATQPTPNI